ncbi:class I SAM-dependent methyltransferase [Treponema brennaborense]|uniref:Methyltransferase type 11 n=1 Tax=Treponema brennaborense (strain DSM 12168 / CIP 105900 / DD5/3) TaxID=906968 RepID=F4LK00_TREBD|nr:class I SAM-dependent methyltransferase [Treponema brennaborense]AEE16480.1 Methyltransferase type 11 [Treponema brennaborense DSM 12168]
MKTERTENTNKHFWQKFAKLYAPFMKKNRSTYNAICRNVTPYIAPDKDVLELACGTGQLTFLMAGTAGTWTATDYSENMIAEIKKRAAVCGVPNTTYEVQDATALRYNDGQFDVVLIANALHIMPHPETALKEIRRVLKRDGILLAPTFVYEKGVPKLLVAVMEKIGFKTYHKWTKAELCTAVSSCGFEIKSCDLIEGNPMPECVLIAGRGRHERA